MDNQKQEGQIDKIPIKLRIEKDEPIDLVPFSKALLSLNNAVNEFVGISTGNTETKISIKSVEKGSDVYFLEILGLTVVLSFADYLSVVNSFFEFFNNIKSIGKRSVDEIKDDKFLTASALNDMENIVNLANQSGVSVTINYNNYKECMIIGQDNKDAYKQGIATARQIKDFENKEQIKKVFEKMSITLYQTTNTDKKVKFRAYCYELSDRAIPILIDDEALKIEILENPYNYRFVCDLEIHKDEKGKISLYRAFNYIDKFEIIKEK